VSREAVVVAVAVAVVVGGAGLIPLVAAVRLRCTTNVAFLRKPRRFSTVSRQLQEAVVVAVVVAVAVVV
jgi:hypothetical protein